MSQPQTAQSPAQAIEGRRGLTTPLSRAMTPVAQQPVFEPGERLIEQGQEKARDQADHQQELQTGFPLPEARTFTRQFTFAQAPRHLDRPAPGIGEDDLAGILLIGDRFGGEQIPGRPSFAGTRHDQPEVLLIGRMGDWDSHDTCLDPLPPPGIPHLPFTEGPSSATDASNRALVALRITELVLFMPTQDEAHLPLETLS